jgi:hypothetical protein
MYWEWKIEGLKNQYGSGGGPWPIEMEGGVPGGLDGVPPEEALRLLLATMRPDGWEHLTRKRLSRSL